MKNKTSSLIIILFLSAITIHSNPKLALKTIEKFNENEPLSPSLPTDSIKTGKIPENLVKTLKEIKEFQKTLSAYLLTQLNPNNIYKCDGLQVKPKGYGIQVGSYVNLDFALNQCNHFVQNYSKVFIEVEQVSGQMVYRVIIGEYKSQIPKMIMNDVSKKVKNAFAKKFKNNGKT